tara:strand:- start:296 stop:727 length:432 start_codon:yes stop_codon:yes gene_type:complete
MFKFFKNKKPVKSSNEINLLSKTASLLIHAAKIDENYTNKEKLIIEKTLLELGINKEKLDELMKTAEKNEENSNQILDFTKDIKSTDKNFKIKLIESLWKIIYSDNNSDMYESSLMRRISGLLYLDSKLVGDLKEKIKNNLNR